MYGYLSFLEFVLIRHHFNEPYLFTVNTAIANAKRQYDALEMEVRVFFLLLLNIYNGLLYLFPIFASDGATSEGLGALREGVGARAPAGGGHEEEARGDAGTAHERAHPRQGTVLMLFCALLCPLMT